MKRAVSENVAEIVRAFCPVICLHDKEKYWPCSTDWFIERSNLVSVTHGDKGPMHTLVVPQREMSEQAVDAAHSAAGELRFELTNPAHRRGMDDVPLDDVPIYAHIKAIKAEAATPGAAADQVVLEICYMTFYAHNGAYHVGVGPLAVLKGAHDGDWEHLSVRCTMSGRLLAVYFSAHRHGDGSWVPPSKLSIDEQTGRIRAFAALNGHGLYCRHGRKLRIYGFANDHCSCVGPVWRPRTCVLLMPDPSSLAAVADRGCKVKGCGAAFDVERAAASVQLAPGAPAWLRWRTRWGSCVSPCHQRWFTQAEHPTGSSTLRRSLLPFLK